MPNEEEIQIRSDEVQEILSAVPNWMIRWGISLIFGIILMLVFISWFIKYPDIIEGQATITTTEPPIKLVSKTSGYLEQLYFKDNTVIQKGQIIAEITNPTNKESIHILDRIVNQLSSAQPIQQNDISSVLTQISNNNLLLGNELSQFNTFVQNLTELNVLLTDKHYQNSIENINQQIKYNTSLAQITHGQIRLLNEEIIHAQEKYEADSMLYEKEVIAKHTFYKNQSELIAKKQEFANAQKDYVNYKVLVTNYIKEKDDLSQQFEQKKRNLNTNIFANVKTIKNYINNWQQNFTFTAPINGKLSYLNHLSKNQFVNSQKPLFAIIPNTKNYIGYVTIPSKGFGKIAKGQKVRVKLNNYPYQEFGQLIGFITYVSPIPTNLNDIKNAYYVTISLPQELTTTYGKHILFTPEMSGTAEIITKDLRLLERIFNKFRKLFDT